MSIKKFLQNMTSSDRISHDLLNVCYFTYSNKKVSTGQSLRDQFRWQYFYGPLSKKFHVGGVFGAINSLHMESNTTR